jgi:hypothetical protein
MNLDSRKYNFKIGFTLTLIIVLILSLCNTCLATAGGGTADFSWLPNTESDLAGYKIHYGTTPNGPYDLVVDAGNPPPVDGRIKGSVSGLTEGVTYYFVATAYNTSGLESNNSTEVAYTCPSAQPDTTPPVGTIIIAAGAATTPVKTVALTLSASDDTSTVTEMKFSNDSVNWNSPELYNTSKNWVLSEGAGSKTVYVQFKDSAGNWSSNYSDAIELIESSQPITTPVLRIKSIGEIHY